MNKNHFKMFMAMLCYALGVAASIYVGGYIMIIKPIQFTIQAHLLGTLTLVQILSTVVKCLLSATVAGLIWCIGYIMSNHFKQH